MKQVACTECQQLAPIGETLLVKQQHVCSSCVEGVLAQAAEKGITKNDVFRASDPTVCTQCKADNGAEELPRLAGMPVCSTCEDRFRNRPYPTWLKLAFVGLVALAIFSFGWNWRFLAATREIHQMQRAIAKQDFERAANLADQASRHVPEIPEFAGVAAFNHGLDALAKDQAAQAVDYLRKAKQSPNRRNCLRSICSCSRRKPSRRSTRNTTTTISSKPKPSLDESPASRGRRG